MNRKIFVVLDIIFLVFMGAMIFFGDVVKSWWDLIVGFVCGLTAQRLLMFFYADKSRKRNLR